MKRCGIVSICSVALMLSATACFKNVAGVQIGSEKVSGSDRVISSKRVIAVGFLPTIDRPQVRLDITRRDSIVYEAQTIHRVRRVANRTLSYLGSLLSFGVAALAISEGDSVTTRGKLLNGVGVAGVLTGLLLVVQAGDDGQNLGPEHIIRKGPRLLYTARESPDQSALVAVTLDGRTVNYPPRQDGSLFISLTEDFGLKRFSKPAEFMLTAKNTSSSEMPLTLRLMSSDWTVHCGQFIEAQGSVWEVPSPRSRIVASFRAGDAYLIVDSRDGWKALRLDESVGWVPQQVLRDFWVPAGGCKRSP